MECAVVNVLEVADNYGKGDGATRQPTNGEIRMNE